MSLALGGIGVSSGPRPASLSLVVMVLTGTLAAACSLSSAAPPPDGIGGARGGVGGQVAVLGLGGSGGAEVDPPPPTGGRCVPSCAMEPTSTYVPMVADGNGILRCPDGTVDYDACSVRACIHHKVRCCDLTTGGVTLAPCQADGTRGGCPDGTVERMSAYQCIPTDLGRSDCDIDLQACSTVGQQCVSGSVCTCRASVPGIDGPAWTCTIFVP